MTAEQIGEIVALAQTRKHSGGDTIVRQFDRNSDLIVILDGNAQILTFKEESVGELGPGSIVGEISLIDEQPRSATVRSMHFTEVAVIPANALRALLDRSPAIAACVYRNIAQTLCTRLRVATINLDGLMGSARAYAH